MLGRTELIEVNSESYPKFQEELLEKKVVCMAIKYVLKNYSKELRIAGELINPIPTI